MMLWLAEPDYERRMAGQILYSGLIDGVIVASNVMDDPVVEALVNGQKLPFIMVGRHPNDSSVSYVDVDNRTGAAQAVEHLIRLGKKRIATIRGPQTMIAGVDRYQGYLDAMAQAKMKIDPHLVVEGEFSQQGGFLAMQKLLPNQPDAVFTASDMIAMGAMMAI